MKKISRLMCCLLCIISLLFSSTAFADGLAVNKLSTIQTLNSSFLKGEKIDQCLLSQVITPWGIAECVSFIQDDNYIGYYIIIDDVIVEFAEHTSPFNKIILGEGESYYYDFSSYSKVNNEEAASLLQNKVLLSDFLNKNDCSDQYTRGLIQSNSVSGFIPMLQGNYNCIAAALSNIIWFWGSNGYPGLVAGLSYNTLKGIIQAGFGGYFANDSVLSVANTFGSSHGYVTFYGGSVWYPSFINVKGQIDAGYPCMVGFAAGSSYSSTVGHMTACYGYDCYASPTAYYMTLADGWSSSPVSKLWTSYNDCVIRVHP